MLPPVPGVMLVVPGQHWGWFHLPERWDWGGNEEFYSKSSIPWGLLVTEIPFPSLVSMGAVWRCFVPTTRHCQGWGFFFLEMPAWSSSPWSWGCSQRWAQAGQAQSLWSQGHWAVLSPWGGSEGPWSAKNPLGGAEMVGKYLDWSLWIIGAIKKIIIDWSLISRRIMYLHLILLRVEWGSQERCFQCLDWLNAFEFQVWILLPCHQHECLPEGAEEGAVQQEWGAARYGKGSCGDWIIPFCRSWNILSSLWQVLISALNLSSF